MSSIKDNFVPRRNKFLAKSMPDALLYDKNKKEFKHIYNVGDGKYFIYTKKETTND